MHESIRSLLVMSAAAAEKTVELQLYETVRLWLVMLVLHVPVYFLWGWVLFRHWADFWDAIGCWFKLEFWYWDFEDYWDARYAAAKLSAWFLAPIGLIGLEMWLLGW